MDSIVPWCFEEGVPRIQDILIDIDRLREDMKQEFYDAYFDRGFGETLVTSFDIETVLDGPKNPG